MAAGDLVYTATKQESDLISLGVRSFNVHYYAVATGSKSANPAALPLDVQITGRL